MGLIPGWGGVGLTIGTLQYPLHAFINIYMYEAERYSNSNMQQIGEKTRGTCGCEALS